MTTAARTARWDRLQVGLTAWLHTLVRNKLVDAIRRKCRHTMVSLEDVLHTDAEPSAAASDPAVRQDWEWMIDLVHVVLEELRPVIGDENVRLLSLVYLQERSQKEVAHSEGLTEDQLDHRLRKARAKFRQLLSLHTGTGFNREP